MHNTGADAVLVTELAQFRNTPVAAGQSASGIVTTRDLRSKVLARDLPPTTVVGEVASFPVKRLPADTPLAEALVFLLENDIHHAPLAGIPTDRPEGPSSLILTDDDILAHYGNDAFTLLRRLVAGSGPTDQFATQVTQAVRGMVRSGVGPGAIGRAVSSLVDGLMRSLCAEAETALGPPPVPYAFCACGSQGRREQTLLTDQDNVLVYADLQTANLADPDAARRWFEALAHHVVDGMLAAGIPSCEGGYMATNWHGDLGWWHQAVQARTADPDPAALLDLNILADLRVVAGTLDPDTLLAPLHRSTSQDLLVRRLASSAMKFRPPGRFSRFFGGDDEFDVKRQGIIPIVGLGRVFGLELGLSTTSSASRLAAAADAGLISDDAQVWLSDGLDFLTGLRLQGQLRSLEQTGSSSAIPLERRDLNSMQEETLRDVLRVVADVQQTTTDRLGLDSVS
jgi:CBS domain-containing protein